MVLPCLAALAPAMALAERVAGSSQRIRVGPGRVVRTLAQASRMARDGAVIEVDAGEYRADVAVWTQDRLALRAVGGRVILKADGAAAEAKAIWVMRGGRITVDGFDFSGARVPDRNGAGIRLESGTLVVSNCRFTDNESGILTSNFPAIELTVLGSEFGRNGDGVGQSHNLYAGSIARLTVQGSYFHDARVGHLLKSRAAVNDIRYNRLADGPAGRSSYELEFPNGGVAYVIGNIIEQGPATENPRMVSYATEGYAWHQNALYLVHNTLIDRKASGGVFLRVRPGDARIVAINNLLVGDGALESAGPGDYRGNTRLARDALAAQATGDYRFHLDPASTAALVDSVNIDGLFLQPQRQFKRPVGTLALPAAPSKPGAIQIQPTGRH